MATLTPTELARLIGVHPVMIAHVLPIEDATERATGKKVYVSEDGGFRSYDTQARIYADSGNGTLYAASAPGFSRHERGRAVDLHIINGTDADYRVMADVAVSRGLTAGYYFSRKDEFHIEIRESLADADAAFADYKKKVGCSCSRTSPALIRRAPSLISSSSSSSSGGSHD